MSVGTDVEKYLGENCKTKLIAVEYVAGDCSKKAIGILGSMTPNFIELVSNTEICPNIGITVYSKNGRPTRESAKELMIMTNNILSVETEPYFGYFRRDLEEKTNKNVIHTPEVDVQGESLPRESEQITDSVKDYDENEQDLDKLSTVQDELIFKPQSEPQFEGLINIYATEEDFIEEREDSWDEEE